MKNRDRYVLKVNEYDMLLRIHTSLYDNYNCVIEMLEGDYKYFKEEDGDLERCRTSEERKDKISCDECIQAWLNKEV